MQLPPPRAFALFSPASQSPLDRIYVDRSAFCLFFLFCFVLGLLLCLDYHWHLPRRCVVAAYTTIFLQYILSCPFLARGCFFLRRTDLNPTDLWLLLPSARDDHDKGQSRRPTGEILEQSPPTSSTIAGGKTTRKTAFWACDLVSKPSFISLVPTYVRTGTCILQSVAFRSSPISYYQKTAIAFSRAEATTSRREKVAPPTNTAVHSHACPVPAWCWRHPDSIVGLLGVPGTPLIMLG